MALVKHKEIAAMQPEARNAIASSQQKLEGGKEGVSPQALRGGWPRLILDLWHSASHKEKKFLLFSATPFVVICDGSHRKVINYLAESGGSGFFGGGGIPPLSQDQGEGQQACFPCKFCLVMGVVGDSQAAHTWPRPASPFMIRHFGRDTVLGTRQEPEGTCQGGWTSGRLKAATQCLNFPF